MSLLFIDQPSPNFNSRDDHPIDMLVMHYTGMRSGAAAIDRLCDDTAHVSAHYVVEEDGRIFKLVPEHERAWHAGISYWRGHSNINQRSIGIEIVNPGHDYGYLPFPPEQMESVAKLSLDILSRYTIPMRNIVGHSDVAPTRKQDPGELFDWAWLAEYHIGCWPTHSKGNATKAEQLAIYGYDIEDLPAAIRAFQRHFRQNDVTGQWDSECAGLLQWLLDATCESQ